MAERSKRPSFVVAFLEDLSEDVRRYGKRKLVPLFLLGALAVGAAAAWLAPAQSFFGKPEISVAFFAAQVTINGLLLGLSWGSFAKIYEIASQPQLAAFLRKHSLLNTYMFHVDFIHATQVIALCMSGAALFVSVFDRLPEFMSTYIELISLQRILLALSIGSSLYALRYALGAVRIMQDLVWYSAQLQSSGNQQGLVLRDGGRS